MSDLDFNDISLDADDSLGIDSDKMNGEELSEITVEAAFEEQVESVDISEEIKSVTDKNVQSLILSASNGEWPGAPSNSEFVMRNEMRCLSGDELC